MILCGPDSGGSRRHALSGHQVPDLCVRLTGLRFASQHSVDGLDAVGHLADAASSPMVVSMMAIGAPPPAWSTWPAQRSRTHCQVGRRPRLVRARSARQRLRSRPGRALLHLAITALDVLHQSSERPRRCSGLIALSTSYSRPDGKRLHFAIPRRRLRPRCNSGRGSPRPGAWS